jgi:hypothetical protein
MLLVPHRRLLLALSVWLKIDLRFFPLCTICPRLSFSIFPHVHNSSLLPPTSSYLTVTVFRYDCLEMKFFGPHFVPCSALCSRSPIESKVTHRRRREGGSRRRRQTIHFDRVQALVISSSGRCIAADYTTCQPDSEAAIRPLRLPSLCSYER